MLSSPTRRIRSPTLLAVVLGAAAVWLLSPGAMRAHADLVESSPAANASLVEAPDALVLAFSEPIDPELAFVDLLDASQARVGGVAEPVIGPGGDELSVALPELAPGVYTVTYQVVSAVDGHATAGLFAFVVDPSGTEPPPPVAAESTSPSVDGWTVAGRWLALGGTLVALGSLLAWWRSRAVLPAGPGSRPPWPLVAAGAGIGLAGLAAYLVLAARPIVAAVPERAVGWPLDVAAPFGTTPFALAMRAGLAGCLLVAITAAIGWSGVARRLDAALAGSATAVLAATLAGMSFAAHAAAAGGPAFAAIDWAHLAAVAAWLGALPALLVLARRSPAAPGLGRTLLRRHGPVALVAAPIVALTGVANSPLVLGEARELVGSGYGNLLLAKAGLLSVAVGIGAVNFLVLRGRGRGAVTALVSAEIGVAVLAIAVAATMVTIQPAAARGPLPTAAPVTPAHLFGAAGPTRVHATVNLPMPGMQSYQVSLDDVETGIPPDDVQRVFLNLEPPTAGLPLERVELTPDAGRPGLYATTGAHLSVEGPWTVEVVVRRAGELDESVAFTVPVRQPSPARLVPPPDTGVGVPAPIGLVWTVLPAGPGGWLPALGALAALVLVGWTTRRRGLTRARRVAQGILLAILAVAVLGAASRTLVAAANAPPPGALEEHAPPIGFEASPALGAALYRANCASCHGADGLGDGPIRTLPPAGALPEVVRGMTGAELSYRIANGYAGTAMPAFAATLTEGERWNLVRHLEDRWR